MIPIGNNSCQAGNRVAQNPVTFKGTLYSKSFSGTVYSKIGDSLSGEAGEIDFKKPGVRTCREFDKSVMDTMTSYIKEQKPADLAVENGNLHIKVKGNKSEYILSSSSNDTVQIFRKEFGNAEDVHIIESPKNSIEENPISGVSEFLTLLKDKITELKDKGSLQAEKKPARTQPQLPPDYYIG